jgi:hypothetical protein
MLFADDTRALSSFGFVGFVLIRKTDFEIQSNHVDGNYGNCLRIRALLVDAKVSITLFRVSKKWVQLYCGEFFGGIPFIYKPKLTPPIR